MPSRFRLGSKRSSVTCDGRLNLPAPICALADMENFKVCTSLVLIPNASDVSAWSGTFNVSQTPSPPQQHTLVSLLGSSIKTSNVQRHTRLIFSWNVLIYPKYVKQQYVGAVFNSCCNSGVKPVFQRAPQTLVSIRSHRFVLKMRKSIYGCKKLHDNKSTESSASSVILSAQKSLTKSLMFFSIVHPDPDSQVDKVCAARPTLSDAANILRDVLRANNCMRLITSSHNLRAHPFSSCLKSTSWNPSASVFRFRFHAVSKCTLTWTVLGQCHALRTQNHWCLPNCFRTCVA